MVKLYLSCEYDVIAKIHLSFDRPFESQFYQLTAQSNV